MDLTSFARGSRSHLKVGIKILEVVKIMDISQQANPETSGWYCGADRTSRDTARQSEAEEEDLTTLVETQLQ